MNWFRMMLICLFYEQVTGWCLERSMVRDGRIRTARSKIFKRGNKLYIVEVAELE